jgi:hypothetical protein
MDCSRFGRVCFEGNEDGVGKRRGNMEDQGMTVIEVVECRGPKSVPART